MKKAEIFALKGSDLKEMGFTECPDGTGDPRGTTYEYKKNGLCIMVDCYRDVILHKENGGDGIPLKIETLLDLKNAKEFIETT